MLLKNNNLESLNRFFFSIPVVKLLGPNWLVVYTKFLYRFPKTKFLILRLSMSQFDNFLLKSITGFSSYFLFNQKF